MAKTIINSNAELLEEAYDTSLKSSVANGVSTLSVYSIANISINQLLLIGEFGQEGSEIIKTHSATAPTGTTVTLASALVKSHPSDTKVYVIPYDQVEYYHAITETGDKTLLSTTDVNKESTETNYVDSTYTSGYYFTRFKNSITSNFSDYSDPIPYGGFSSNTVGYMISMVMKKLNKEFNDILTYDMVIGEINSCLRYVKGKLKRWSNTQEFDYVIGRMNRGEYKFALPTTYYDKNSNRSCLNVRLGNRILDYIDKIELNEKMEDVHHTTVATTASVGATSLVLTSSDDFDSTGTIHIYKSNTLYEIDYTANDKDTNTLTCTALTAEITSGLDVWQDEAEGTPDYFTIYDGYLYIWGLNNATHQGENIYMDFHTDIVEVDSDSDEITLARHDLIKHWIKWQVRNITENNGKPDFQDGDWILFNTMLSDAVRRESSGQKFKRSIVINGITYRGETNQSFDKV